MTAIEKQKADWAARAREGRFFGEAISKLDTDGLLAVIGCLVESQERDAKRHEEERAFWKAISGSRYA